MSFTMEVVNQEQIKAAIEEEVKPEPAEVTQLKEQAQNNVSAILNLDLDSLDKRREMLQSIENFGLGTMRVSSQKKFPAASSGREVVPDRG